MDLTKLLNAEHWFNPNPGPPSLAYFALAFAFAMLLGASVYLYASRKRLFGGHRLKARVARQMAMVGAALSLVGLLLIVGRFLLVSYLSARALVYLVSIVLVIGAVYYAYYLLRVFPFRLIAYEAEAVRRKYSPKPSNPSGRCSKKRGKRRR